MRAPEVEVNVVLSERVVIGVGDVGLEGALSRRVSWRGDVRVVVLRRGVTVNLCQALKVGDTHIVDLVVVPDADQSCSKVITASATLESEKGECEDLRIFSTMALTSGDENSWR